MPGLLGWDAVVNSSIYIVIHFISANAPTMPTSDPSTYEEETTVHRLFRLLDEAHQLEMDLKQPQESANSVVNEKQQQSHSTKKTHQTSAAALAQLNATLARCTTASSSAGSSPSLANPAASQLLAKLGAFKEQHSTAATHTANTSVTSTAAETAAAAKSDSVMYELFYSPQLARTISSTTTTMTTSSTTTASSSVKHLPALASPIIPASPSSPSSRLGDLESRLATLENLIGTHHLSSSSSTTTATSSLLSSSNHHVSTNSSSFQISTTASLLAHANCSTLIDAVHSLHTYMSLLTQPGALEAIVRRVRAVGGEVERVEGVWKRRGAEGRASAVLTGAAGDYQQQRPISTPTTTTAIPLSSNTSTISPDLAATLISLNTHLTALSPLTPLLPPLISRLHALKSLHADAAGWDDCVKMLVQTADVLETGLKRVQASVDELKVGVYGGGKDKGTGLDGTVESNFESLVARCKRLEERVDLLIQKKI